MVFTKTVFPGRGGNQRNIAEEDAASGRWREIILKLSDNLREAADVRSDLSPVFMEALHSALENLLLLGEEADLIALEEWLDHERESRLIADPHAERETKWTQRGAQRRQVNRRNAPKPDADSAQSSAAATSNHSGNEASRRSGRERRTQRERRAS